MHFTGRLHGVTGDIKARDYWYLQGVFVLAGDCAASLPVGTLELLVRREKRGYRRGNDFKQLFF